MTGGFLKTAREAGESPNRLLEQELRALSSKTASKQRESYDGIRRKTET